MNPPVILSNLLHANITQGTVANTFNKHSQIVAKSLPYPSKITPLASLGGSWGHLHHQISPNTSFVTIFGRFGVALGVPPAPYFHTFEALGPFDVNFVVLFASVFFETPFLNNF